MYTNKKKIKSIKIINTIIYKSMLISIVYFQVPIIDIFSIRYFSINTYNVDYKTFLNGNNLHLKLPLKG